MTNADPQHSALPTDLDALRAIVSDPIIKRGIAYFKEHRVTALDFDPEHAWATVEGSVPGAPYTVALTLDEDDELVVDCDCPFDGEPVCKHAVATLLAVGSKLPVEADAVASSAAQAVEERAQRARTEVVVEHLRGRPWFGTWSARSLGTPSSALGHHYRVQIRAVGERMNSCTCPDYATNRLGTCKHIEAVLFRVRREHPERFTKEALAEAAPLSFVHLSWAALDGPHIRLVPGQGYDDEHAGILGRYFDAEGAWCGRLPDDFHRLQRELAMRSLDAGALHIGAEVVDHVARLAEEAAHQRDAARLQDAIRAADAHLPGIAARLYPYQIEGVAFLASNGRALLADDMGLGKTLQAIAATVWLMEHRGVRRTLVVCPASLKHQWAREIVKFTALTPDDVVIVQGPVATRCAQYRAGAPITIANYELVLRDLELVNRDLRPDLVILDEAQRIKNWRTKTATAIKSVVSRYAFVLTGTPLENRLEDLYSLLQVVDSRVLGPLWRFMLDFHVTDERGKVLGYRNLSELRQRLGAVMLRRDRRLVRDQLPERIVQRLDVPMTAHQRNLHDGALSSAASLAQLSKRRPLTPSEQQRLLAALQSARMACDAAGLVDKETVGSPKLEELANLLGDLCVDGGIKVVVFSEWERMTAAAAEVADRLGIGYVRLSGSVPTANRGALIDRFHDDPACQIFFSTDAGGVGLNLQCAQALINLDIPWNPAVLDQRIARIHRLGQRETVQIVLLVADESYEQRVHQLVGAKRELFVNVVDADATEDVVGVSKRALVELVELVPEARATPAEDEEAPAAPTELLEETETAEEEDRGAPTEAPIPEASSDENMQRLIVGLQSGLGARLEQVLGVPGGLIAVVQLVEPDDEALAEALSGELPVAILDRRSVAALRRLGAASPLAAATAHAMPEPKPPQQQVWQQVERKLSAGELLIRRGAVEEGLGLLGHAMLLTVAVAGGLQQAPAGPQGLVWLYGEALPAGWVDAAGAAAIGRAVGLANAPYVPEPLLQEVIADARQLVGGNAARA